MNRNGLLKIVCIIALYVSATVALTFAVNIAIRHDEPLVYITKSGSKYHSDDCGYLWASSIPIGKYEADKRGYTPCSRCGGAPSGTIIVNDYVLSFCISAMAVCSFHIWQKQLRTKKRKQKVR